MKKNPPGNLKNHLWRSSFAGKAFWRFNLFSDTCLIFTAIFPWQKYTRQYVSPCIKKSVRDCSLSFMNLQQSVFTWKGQSFMNLEQSIFTWKGGHLVLALFASINKMKSNLFFPWRYHFYLHNSFDVWMVF